MLRQCFALLSTRLSVDFFVCLFVCQRMLTMIIILSSFRSFYFLLIIISLSFSFLP